MRLHKPKEDRSKYVMFGFSLADPDETGFLAKIPTDVEDEDIICDDMKEAKVFPASNEDGITGFGTPQQWLEFVNEEFKDIYGPYAWKFHLVKTCL